MTQSQPYQTVYMNTVGYVIDLALVDQFGNAINLTDGAGTASVTLNLFAIGTNIPVWSHACSVTDTVNGLATYTTVAGDLATPGEYFSQVLIAYSSTTTTMTETGPSISVSRLAAPETYVTIDELRVFMDIPTENFKPDPAVRMYLEQAQSVIDLDVPDLLTSTDPRFIRIKKTLMSLQGSILYYMNSDENLVDPNKRNPKIELWTKQYNKLVLKLNDLLSNNVTENAGARRIYNGDYFNPESPLYDPTLGQMMGDP
jgi:hypothetical protein